MRDAAVLAAALSVTTVDAGGGLIRQITDP
jgi:hypothetical protein